MRSVIVSLCLVLCATASARATNCVAVQVVGGSPHLVSANIVPAAVVVQPSVNTFSFRPVAVHTFSQPFFISNVVTPVVINQQVAVQRVVIQRVRRGLFGRQIIRSRVIRNRVFGNRVIIRSRSICR